MKPLSQQHWLAAPLILAFSASARLEPAPSEDRVAVVKAPAGPITPTPKPPAAETLERGFADVAARVGPAVVNIQATSKGGPAFGLGEHKPRALPFDDPFFGPFFRDPFGPFEDQPPQGERRVHAQGSGVIVSADGRILTNAHVIEGADDVSVFLADQRELKARVIGIDAKTDIAVLDVAVDDLPFLPLGESDKVRVGDFALAVGNPFAVGQTVTLGIVSATGRGQLGIVDYEDFIQTDAAINPGNSGGALVNTRGELIGIATAIVTGGGRGNTGVGFAVPSKMAGAVMQQIVDQGRVTRGWLGVAIQDVTSSLSEALHLGVKRGALVGDVIDGGPAAKAGLRRGDVVVALEGAPITDARTLRLAIGATKPGTKVRLSVLRSNKERDVDIVLQELPEDVAVAAVGAPNPAPTTLGIQVRPLTKDLAERLAVPPHTQGVVVASIVPGSRAADAGLRPGDLIVEVDGKAVPTTRDLTQALAKSKGRLLLLVMREGITTFVVVEP